MMIDIYMEILILLTIGDLTIAGILGGYKALMLLFGALMSFSTRSVSENFNESKPIALSVMYISIPLLGYTPTTRDIYH
jgi:hypothetical protein